MQILRLRDIPSPSITNVPAGVKFLGMKAPHEGAPIDISTCRAVPPAISGTGRTRCDAGLTEDSVNWNKLTSICRKPPFAENANAVVIQYQGKPCRSSDGGDQVPYPQ